MVYTKSVETKEIIYPELVKEINELRIDSKKYAEKIKGYKQYFKEGTYIWKHPDLKAEILTEEGPTPYDEAIDFL